MLHCVWWEKVFIFFLTWWKVHKSTQKYAPGISILTNVIVPKGLQPRGALKPWIQEGTAAGGSLLGPQTSAFWNLRGGWVHTQWASSCCPHGGEGLCAWGSKPSHFQLEESFEYIWPWFKNPSWWACLTFVHSVNLQFLNEIESSNAEAVASIKALINTVEEERERIPIPT